jgi:hypothetical protein
MKGTQKRFYKREINKNSIAEFQLILSWEQWNDIFQSTDVNNMFNNFLNTFLRCFYASFQKKKITNNNNQSKWITNGIRISCKRKRELILLCRHSNDANLKSYYKLYSKILAKVIKAAKKLHYNRIILNSENKMKTTWRIINEEKGKPKHDSGIQSLMLNNKLIRNQKEIADTFNRYFITIADSIPVNNNNNKHSANTVIQLLICRIFFKSPFSKMTWKYASTHEIKIQGF